MIKRARRVARRGASAYLRTLRNASPNVRRYLLSVALINAAIGLLGTAFALYLHSRGMSASVVGDVEGALALASGVVCLVLPPLVSVVGYRVLLVATGLAFALSRFGQILGVGPTAIIALGLVYGIGDGVSRSIGVAFLSENGPDGSERTLLFTADFALRVLASFAGALLGGLLPTLLRQWMPDAQALRWTVAVAGALFLASSVPVLGVKEGPRPKVVHPRRVYLDSIRGFRSWDRLMRLAIPEAIISFGAGLVMPFVPLFLSEHAGASVAQIGFIQSATAIFMALATLCTPLVARRLGLVGTIVVTQLASLPFLLVMPLSASLPIIAIAMCARVSLMNMAWPVYNQVAVDGVPSTDKPLVLGWVSVAWSISWLGGSVVGGRLAETSLTVGYFITTGLYALGAITSWLLLRRVKFTAQEPAAETLAEEVAEPAA